MSMIHLTHLIHSSCETSYYKNDVTASWGGGKGLCDDIVQALVLKSVKMGSGRGVKNYPKLRNVIYGRPPHV